MAKYTNIYNVFEALSSNPLPAYALTVQPYIDPDIVSNMDKTIEAGGIVNDSLSIGYYIAGGTNVDPKKRVIYSALDKDSVMEILKKEYNITNFNMESISIDKSDDVEVEKLIKFFNSVNGENILNLTISEMNSLTKILRAVNANKPVISREGKNISISITTQAVMGLKEAIEEFRKLKIMVDEVVAKDPSMKNKFSADMKKYESQLAELEALYKDATKAIAEVQKELAGIVGEEVKKKISSAKTVEDLSKVKVMMSDAISEETRRTLDKELLKKAESMGISKEDLDSNAFKMASEDVMKLINSFKTLKTEKKQDIDENYFYVKQTIKNRKAYWKVGVSKSQIVLFDEIDKYLDEIYKTKVAQIDGNHFLKQAGVNPETGKPKEESVQSEAGKKPEAQDKMQPVRPASEKEIQAKQDVIATVGYYVIVKGNNIMKFGEPNAFDRSSWKRPDSFAEEDKMAKSAMKSLGDALEEIFGYTPPHETRALIQHYSKTREFLYSTVNLLGRSTLGVLMGGPAAAVAELTHKDPKKAFEAAKDLGEDIVKLFSYEVFGDPEKINPSLTKLENDIRRKIGVKPIIPADKTKKRKSGVESKLLQKANEGAPAVASVTPGVTMQTGMSLVSSDPYNLAPATRDSEGSALAVSPRKKKKKKVVNELQDLYLLLKKIDIYGK